MQPAFAQMLILLWGEDPSDTNTSAPVPDIGWTARSRFLNWTGAMR